MRRALLLSAVLATAAHAQPGDWATLDLGLGATAPIAGGFVAPWRAGPGGAARLAVPAYGGLVRAALDVNAYDVEAADAGAADGLPDFGLVAATLGWGPGLALPGGARAWAGVEVGAVLLRFETVETGGFQNTTETEAAVGAWVRLSAPVAGRVQAWAEGRALRVALAEPATLTAVTAGLAVRLDTPGWLRGVLR